MISDSEMYTETFEILACMNKQEVMRIPVNILEFIKQERSKTYITRIDKNDLFNPENIDQKTVDLLTGLIIYYMGTEEQKDFFIKRAKENDFKRDEEKREIYSVNIFEEKDVKEKDVKEKDVEEKMELIIKEKEDTLFMRIIRNLKKILKFRKK